ncbi:hypothetical protein EDB89DRAFT_1996284 [Lactarius sanguifluus]|nr:hypothetical protein EDB89DRAFT_1996284 [Lactarius sanguifluus]
MPQPIPGRGVWGSWACLSLSLPLRRPHRSLPPPSFLPPSLLPTRSRAASTGLDVLKRNLQRVDEFLRARIVPHLRFPLAAVWRWRFDLRTPCRRCGTRTYDDFPSPFRFLVLRGLRRGGGGGEEEEEEPKDMMPSGRPTHLQWALVTIVTGDNAHLDVAGRPRVTNELARGRWGSRWDQW